MVYSAWRLNFEESPERCRGCFNPRGTADPQLMSAAASPGRTWNVRALECRLPVLAGKAAAAIPYHGSRRPYLPDMGGVPPSSREANFWNEGHPGRQSVHEWVAPGRVGCVNDSLSIEWSA